jgi:hypothetical protein
VRGDLTGLLRVAVPGISAKWRAIAVLDQSILRVSYDRKRRAVPGQHRFYKRGFVVVSHGVGTAWGILFALRDDLEGKMKQLAEIDYVVTRHFVDGMIAMGLLTGSHFFLRFWRDTRDRLFVFFSAALLLLAINRTMGNESSLVPYIIRLAGYGIIIIGIMDKNFRRT